MSEIFDSSFRISSSCFGGALSPVCQMLHLPIVSLAARSMKTLMTNLKRSSGSSEGRTSLYSYCNPNVCIHRQSGKYSVIIGQNDLVRSTARTRRSLAQLATTSSSAPPEARSSSWMLVIAKEGLRNKEETVFLQHGFVICSNIACTDGHWCIADHLCSCGQWCSGKHF